MSENVEIVRRLYGAMDARDPEALAGLAHPDAEWIPDGRVGEGPVRGRENVIRFFTDRAEMFDELRAEPERFWETEHGVLVFVRVTGRGDTSGAGIDIRIAHLWTVRDGVVVRGEGYGDRQKALEAAGVSESDTDPDGTAQTNVGIVRRFLDGAHEDPDAVWDIFDEAVVWEIGPLRVPDFPATSRGPDQVREFFRRWAGSFDDWDFETEEPVPIGRNGVLVGIQQWGRGKESGARVDLRFWQAWEMRDGKAIRVTHHYERADALDDIGTSD